jgi:hypothetical protein
MVRLSRLPPVGYAKDIETGKFELADTTLAAAEKMFNRIPDAQLWFERIGAAGVHKFSSYKFEIQF